jgi:RimJ/RimL family protein N-acetyltransferase
MYLDDYINIYYKQASIKTQLKLVGNTIYNLPGHLYSVYSNDKQIGEVGVFEYDGKKCSHIEIKPEYRGKGYSNIMYDELIKTEKLDHLYAIIKHDNIASIKSHTKLGFVLCKKGNDRDLYKFSQ